MKNIKSWNLFEGNNKWTPARVKTEASKYKNRDEFRTKSPSAYGASKGFGLLDKIFPDSGVKIMTQEEVRKIALDYNSKSELRKGNSRAYFAAKELGIIEDLYKKS